MARTDMRIATEDSIVFDANLIIGRKGTYLGDEATKTTGIVLGVIKEPKSQVNFLVENCYSRRVTIISYDEFRFNGTKQKI